MMLRSLLTGGAMLALTIGSAQAQAQGVDPKHRQFLYFLPTGNAGAAVTQQIASCPEKLGDVPKVITVISIGGEIGPDTALPLTMDARAGFLSKRSTKLALHADGTLDTFNATAEGQGGPVLASVIKTAATVAAWSMGIPVPPPGIASLTEKGGQPFREFTPPPPPLLCTAETAATVSELSAVRDKIDAIETAAIGAGLASPSSANLERLRDEEKALVAALTIRAGTPATFAPKRDDFPAGRDEMTRTLPAAPIEQWFRRSLGGSAAVQHDEVYAAFPGLTGGNGYHVTLSPDRDLLNAFAGDGSSYVATPSRAVYYRRAVTATITVAPCTTGATTCEADTSPAGKRASKSGDVTLPQLSGLYSLSIGNGGIFGTSEATVAFDASGSPTKLEYGNAAGGADIAGVIDAGAEGMTTIRDGRLAGIKRATETITAENDLAAALAAHK